MWGDSPTGNLAEGDMEADRCVRFPNELAHAGAKTRERLGGKEGGGGEGTSLDPFPAGLRSPC